MEFLRTPDPSAAWAVTPRTANPESNASTVTPVPPNPVSTAPHLDRNSIKSSFQTLFTPNVAATPQFIAKPGAPSGLTPFINGVVTPNFVTPGIGMIPMTAALKGDLSVPQSATSPEMLLSSPYLQAAAKEAVRREFMNMPTYITGQMPMPQTPGEQTVPAAQTPSQQQLVYASDGGLVTSVPAASSPVATQNKPPPAQAATSPDGEARVPEARPSQPASQTGGEGAVKTAHANPTSPENQRVPQPPPGASPAPPANPAAQPPMRNGQPAFAHGQQRPFYQMHPSQGMYLMPQNGPMMMHPPPGNPIYIHPATGMMMFAPPGAPQHQLMPHPGMMMHPVHPAAMAPGQNRAPMKPETAAERKERIEREKQELIREFKKKTREAALVRFRQKRRERRFGKLIRYDCRKKLADARPRVKGRFVRIKADSGTDDTEDSAQVVPSME